jgi:hypothetical protein
LLELNRYRPHPEDKGVIAFPTDHTSPDGKSKNIKFTIKAMLIELTPFHRARQEAYDRMIRQTSREARKSERRDRRKKAGEHEADEL